MLSPPDDATDRNFDALPVDKHDPTKRIQQLTAPTIRSSPTPGARSFTSIYPRRSTPMAAPN